MERRRLSSSYHCSCIKLTQCYNKLPIKSIDTFLNSMNQRDTSEWPAILEPLPSCTCRLPLAAPFPGWRTNKLAFPRKLFPRGAIPPMRPLLAHAVPCERRSPTRTEPFDVRPNKSATEIPFGFLGNQISCSGGCSSGSDALPPSPI
jgi:hypothetical protein